MAKTKSTTDADLAQVRTDLAALLAREAAQRATALASETTDKAVSLSKERDAAAIVLAEERVRREANVDERLTNHDAHFKIVNGSIDRGAMASEILTQELRAWITKQEKRDTEFDTRNQEVDERSRKHWHESGQAFSKKQIYLGFFTMAAMLATPIVTEIIKLIAGA